MKDFIKILGFILIFLLFIFGIGSYKYHFWRAEHPNAPTWTFFIPKGK